MNSLSCFTHTSHSSNDLEHGILSKKNSERSPLIQHSHGRCWCCWESTQTPRNPLIRACLGCKDPDLQLIHQECIDQYINALPATSTHDPHHCTRCNDAYIITVARISPFTLIKKDKFLCLSLSFMVFCMLVLSWCSMSLFMRHITADIMVLDTEWVQITLSTFALLMFVFCHVIHFVTWQMVYTHFDGYSTKKVFSAL